MGLLQRVVRSRRLRLFFIVSLLLHVAVGLALVFSPGLRGLLFGGDKPTGPPAASARDVQRAIAARKKRLHEQLAGIQRDLADIAARLDAHQRGALERLQRLDAERVALAKEGKWPPVQKGQKPQRREYVPKADVVPPELPALPAGDPKADALDVLYGRLAPLEERCGRLFERWHACSLASHAEEPIPLSTGLQNVRLKLTERKTLAPGALATDHITTNIGEELPRFYATLDEMYFEAIDMNATARRWLDLLEKREGEAQTMFGEQTKFIPPPNPYYGHFLDPKLLKPVKLERMFSPPFQLGVLLGEGGEVTQPTEWISLDRWYVVGPFSHPGASRRLEDLERVFPPERNVDLDAVYEGKNGPLRWKYRHIGPDFLEGGMRVQPYVVDNGPYAIWYFYTEVVSDRDQRVLTSFASDDYGVCWVNGQRVFQSPPSAQPWVPFTQQGFRAVQLRRGANRFLFKLENGLGSTDFSVVLMTHQDDELIQMVEAKNQAQ